MNGLRWIILRVDRQKVNSQDEIYLDKKIFRSWIFIENNFITLL